MTSKLTREKRINEVKELIANAEKWAGFYEHPIHDKPQREMFEGMAKVMSEHLAALAAMDSEPVAAMDSEPVAWDYEWASCITCEGPQNFNCVIEHEAPSEWAVEEGRARNIIPLYRHAQPAPVIPSELHPDTKKLVTEFCTALAEKLFKAQLKYGHSDNWSYANWEIECQTAFHEHIAKGDPRDVAAYCAFMWYHGWKTEAAQPAPVALKDHQIRELVNQLRDIAIEYHGAQQLRERIARVLRAAMINGGKS